MAQQWRIMIIILGFGTCLGLPESASAQDSQEEKSDYVRLHVEQQLTLFDDADHLIPNINTTADAPAVDITLLGYVPAADACSKKMISQLAMSAAPKVVLSRAQPASDSETVGVTLFEIVRGHSDAIQSAGTASFIFLYQTTTNPAQLAELFLHPLESLSCGVETLRQQTVLKIDAGLQRRDAALVAEGTTNLLVAVVSFGTSYENAQRLLTKNLGNIGGAVAQRLDDLALRAGHPLGQAIGQGEALAWRPALVSTLPVQYTAVQVARSGAAVSGVAGMGIVLNYADNRFGQAEESDAPDHTEYVFKEEVIVKIRSEHDLWVDLFFDEDATHNIYKNDFVYLGTVTENKTGKLYHIAGSVTECVIYPDGRAAMQIKVTHRQLVRPEIIPTHPIAWNDSMRFRSRFYFVANVGTLVE